MGQYFHSVRLDHERCKGCVNCIKRCPTEAIRIRGGKAHILEARCIDCGECIRRCPSHAKTTFTDSLSDLTNYKYNIALPAPTIYSQFKLEVPIESILSGLLKLGFDAVFEVAQGAEMTTLAIKEYLKRSDIKRPAISSACPTVVRLIQVKFPELIEHLIPIKAPMEVTAQFARECYSSEKNINPDEIGIWFITPCPAKMTAVKQPLGFEKSNVTGAIAISKIYGDLLKVINPACGGVKHDKTASATGIGWAMAGGEITALDVENALQVHEIQNVNDILEQVALGKLKNIDYIEATVCAGGCIGGPLTVESRFVAQYNLKQRVKQKRTAEEANGKVQSQDYLHSKYGNMERKAIEPRPVMRLDEDISKAIYKVEAMEKTLVNLPGLDCGSCGSPNCKALAEDIAQGIAVETDCVFKLRERVRDLAREMVDLAEKLPPSLEKKVGLDEKG